MSAVVERPTPAQHPRYLPRAPSVEVIDVDLLDDDDVHGPRRNAQRTEVINIVDDDDGPTVDDDEIEFVGMSRPRSPVSRPARRLRSPPLRREPSEAPPMPPFPRQYSSWRSLPARRSRHSAASSSAARDAGVLRPNATLPFELTASYEAGPSWRRLPSPRPTVPRAAPPAHATPEHPRMGFGSTILSEQRRTSRVSNYLALIHSLAPRLGLDPWNEDNWDDDWALALGSDESRPYRLFGNKRPDEPMYKPDYTHPIPARPGFTNDFGSPGGETDATSPSSSGASAANGARLVKIECALLCTCCSTPLVLGDNLDALSPEEQRAHKLWGLRCGHMIDGRCFEEVSRPAPEDDVPVKGKGKGRAKTRNNGLYLRNLEDDAASYDPSSVRGRLRNRNPQSGLAAPTSPSRARPASNPSPRSLKRKRKSAVPLVEAEYEWACPVENCDRVHKSLKVDGSWIQHKEAGAMSVFV
ncbi:hypothetical protein BD626DRAFT_572617 [Schizophyllum amplum]|uniref:Uncharacterized protein n=1 Tax=Schizophyllum amplum TaxID=97359 RepID=A0A550C3D6_9AGAR|nr:hypothetical protein BD626DRAFT_572617 [Auriculariopsis ampla]